MLGPFAMVTTTGPVVVPDGTGALIWLLPQVVGVAVTPLKVTEFAPWVEPKFDPLIVTSTPI